MPTGDLACLMVPRDVLRRARVYVFVEKESLLRSAGVLNDDGTRRPGATVGPDYVELVEATEQLLTEIDGLLSGPKAVDRIEAGAGSMRVSGAGR